MGRPRFRGRTRQDEAAPPFGAGNDPDRWRFRRRISRRWIATEVALGVLLASGGVAAAMWPEAPRNGRALPRWIMLPLGVVAGAVVVGAAFLRREVVVDGRARHVVSTVSLGPCPIWRQVCPFDRIAGVDVVTQEAHERRARGGGGKAMIPPQNWIVLRHAAGDVSLRHHWVYASRTAARRAAKPLVEHFGFAQLYEDPDLAPGAGVGE